MDETRAKARIKQALFRDRGDDLERADSAYARLSNAQLQEECGMSGKTYQQHWDRYKQDREEWEDAYALASQLIGFD